MRDIGAFSAVGIEGRRLDGPLYRRPTASKKPDDSLRHLAWISL
jgi:hypothetical protein